MVVVVVVVAVVAVVIVVVVVVVVIVVVVVVVVVEEVEVGPGVGGVVVVAAAVIVVAAGGRLLFDAIVFAGSFQTCVRDCVPSAGRSSQGKQVHLCSVCRGKVLKVLRWPNTLKPMSRRQAFGACCA